ncbi:MAG: MFS transporter [Actinomycetota bacterium]|nr:MFS transporter [Actinomycetota bacterium]
MTDDRPTPEEELAAQERAGIDRPGRLGFLNQITIDLSPLRESPPFRRLFFGQSISWFAGEITWIAVPIQLYGLTHSTLQVGLLYLTTLGPLLIAPIVGGAVADAVDRRTMLLIAEGGFALVSIALAVNASLPDPHVWALYLLDFVGTAVFSFGTPALRSLLPRIVRKEKIVAASALDSLASNFNAVAGPAIGGLVIAGIGFTGTYLLDFASFSASLVSIWMLPKLPAASGAEAASLGSILEGFRYVRSQPVILGIFLVDTNAMIFGMPMALFPALGEHFGGGSKTVGFLYAAPYAGALVASVFSGWAGNVRRQGLGVVIAAAMWGIALVAFGFADALWLALVMLAVAGAADFVSALWRSAIVLTATPDAMRGRVTGIEFTQVAAAPTFGNLEAGVVASFTSLRFSIVSGGIACVAGCIALALAIPQLLRYDARAKRE